MIGEQITEGGTIKGLFFRLFVCLVGFLSVNEELFWDVVQSIHMFRPPSKTELSDYCAEDSIQGR